MEQNSFRRRDSFQGILDSRGIWREVVSVWKREFGAWKEWILWIRSWSVFSPLYKLISGLERNIWTRIQLQNNQPELSNNPYRWVKSGSSMLLFGRQDTNVQVWKIGVNGNESVQEAGDKVFPEKFWTKGVSQLLVAKTAQNKKNLINIPRENLNISMEWLYEIS